MQKKLLVIGSMNVDMVVKTQRIPHAGETILGGVFNQFYGGKGANQAVAAKTLFPQTCFCAACGKDSIGDDYVKYLKSKKLDVSLIKRDKTAHTGVALITLDKNGENVITVAPGANMALKPADIKKIDFAKFSHAAFQLETDIKTVAAGLQAAKKAGCTTILTPAPARKIPAAMLKNIDFLLPNQHEILLLQDGFDSPEAAAQSLIKKGVKNVIITLGSKGSMLVNKDGKSTFGVFKTKCVDTVGAGDCFTGSLMAGLRRYNGDTAKAIIFATAAASLAVSRMGAQNFAPLTDVLKKTREGKSARACFGGGGQAGACTPLL